MLYCQKVKNLYIVEIEFNSKATKGISMDHNSDEAESSLQSLAQSLPGIIFHVAVDADESLHPIFVCSESETILGLNARDIEKDPSHLWNLIPADERKEVYDVIQQCRKTERKLRLEFRIHSHEGMDRWMHVEAIAQKRLRGHEEDWLGVALDVTEAHRQKRRIEEAHALLDGILSSIEDAIFVIGPPQRHLVKSMNRAVENIFGYRPEELEGNTTQILHESRESFERFGHRTEKVLKTGRTFRGEYRMRRKNGEIFPTEHVISVLHREAGLQGGVVSVVRDISAQQASKYPHPEGAALKNPPIGGTRPCPHKGGGP